MINTPTAQSNTPIKPSSYFSSLRKLIRLIPVRVNQVNTIIPATVATERIPVNKANPIQP